MVVMSRCHPSIRYALLALLPLGGCATQTPPGSPGPSFHAPPTTLPLAVGVTIDFDTALDRALAVSPSLNARQADYQAAIQSAGAVYDLRNPEIRLGYQEDDGSFYETERVDRLATDPLRSPDTMTSGKTYDAAIRFFPPNPFVLTPTRRAAESRADAAALRIEHEKILVADLVRAAWLALAYTQEEVRLARKHAELADAYTDRMNAMAREGAASALDAAGADVAAFQALREHHDALAGWREALQSLAILLHADAGSMLFTGAEWTRPPDQNPVIMDAELAVQRALAHDASLAALTHDAQAAEAAYRAARRAWIPWPGYIQAGISDERDRRYRTSDEQIIRRYADSQSWDISLAVEVPIFSAIHRQPDVMRSQWEALTVQADLDRAGKAAMVRQLMARVQQGWSDWNTFNARAETVMARLRQLQEMITGSGGHNLTDAHRLAIQRIIIERQLLRADFRLRRDLLQLESLTGGLGSASF